jgi:hypothetical protein
VVGDGRRETVGPDAGAETRVAGRRVEGDGRRETVGPDAGRWAKRGSRKWKVESGSGTA